MPASSGAGDANGRVIYCVAVLSAQVAAIGKDKQGDPTPCSLYRRGRERCGRWGQDGDVIRAECTSTTRLRVL